MARRLRTGEAVELTVHRLIERHVATCGDAVALVHEDRYVTYRELNQRANLLARRLMSSGFRRQSHAIVSMPCSVDLAVTLLAVLKAGGTYTWLPPGSMPTAQAYPPFSFSVSRGDDGDDRYLALNISPLLAEDDKPASNLPVLTRTNEPACLLPNEQGRLAVVVPHDSIVALQQRDESGVEWRGEPGAFDLWVGLMRGATVSVMPTVDTAAFETAA